MEILIFKERIVKKVLIIFAMMLFSISFAETSTNWDSEAALKRVNTIGTKLLKANNINHDIKFTVSNTDDINAYADINKEVHVYKGLLQYVDNDEELAGVISHEMGHIINGHCAKQGILNAGIASVANAVTTNEYANAIGQTLASSKISRNDEFEADISGVDIMTKAGYNPLAMISLLNKISGNYLDIFESHPSGEKRLMNVYNYIEYNYPSKIKAGFKSDSYTKALKVITPNVEKRKASKWQTARYERQQKKLLAKKEKRLKKMQGTNTVWDGYFATLQYLSTGE